MQIKTINFIFILSVLPFFAFASDHEQQQFSNFAEQLADFLPTQAFQFQLAPAEQQSFIFWPSPDIKLLRGMFYITSEDTNGLFVGCESGGVMQKTFFDKNIGVFSANYSSNGDMKLILKSEVKHLKIYLSYQFVDAKKLVGSSSQSEESSEPSQLAKILAKFTKVRNTLYGQEQILKSILNSQYLEVQRLKQETESKTTRVIIETGVLILSGFISLSMLKKQFKKGYDLIV